VSKPFLKKINRLVVFEKEVLYRIYGPTRDEMIKGWGKYEDLHRLYC
jgi:hypothetical protein